MPEQDINTGPNAADANAFEAIFNESGQDAIGDGPTTEGNQPTTTSTQAPAESGSPTQGNQVPGGDEPKDGNEAAPEGQAQQEQEIDPNDPKTDPKRVEYWQSRADKTAAELDKFKSQVESQTPLVKYINENPELAQQVYGQVQQHLNGDAGQPQGSSDGTPQATQQPALERPTKPSKPSSYDPVDAVSDTDSESYKYRQELEAYNEALVDYNEQIMERQANEAKQRQAKAQEQAQRNQQLKQTYNEAVYRHGMEPKQAASFVQWASQPEYSMEDLIAVYNMRQKNQGAATRKADLARQKNQQLETPPPPSAQGNDVTRQTQQINEEDPQQMGELFVNDLMKNAGMGD